MPVAADVMAKNLVTLSPDDTAKEAIEILLKHRISGAPVVDSSGKLVGIISEFQLLEVAYNSEIKSLRVGEMMTKSVFTVNEDTPLDQVANLFVLFKIRRVPVVQDNRLVGLVSRRDILRHAVSGASDDDWMKPAGRKPVDLSPVHSET